LDLIRSKEELNNKKGNKMATKTKHMEHIEPYSAQAGTMIPTPFRKFLRTCVIWQLIRFIAINIKMTILILKSHH
jgi:hypothetical protein